MTTNKLKTILTKEKNQLEKEISEIIHGHQKSVHKEKNEFEKVKNNFVKAWHRENEQMQKEIDAILLDFYKTQKLEKEKTIRDDIFQVIWDMEVEEMNHELYDIMATHQKAPIVLKDYSSIGKNDIDIAVRFFQEGPQPA